MNIEELKQLCSEILQGAEQARLSEIVTIITENYSNLFNDVIIKQNNIDSLKNENDSLRNQNMQLYLKIGSTQENKENEKDEEIEQEEVLSYDDLFDENGNLK